MHPFVYVFGLRLPTYGLLVVTGLLLGGAIALFRCKRHAVIVEDAIIAMACAGGFGILGSKILYLLASVPRDKLLEMIRTGDLLGLLMNGQVFLGGLIGGIAGGFLGAKIAKADIRKLIDAILPSLPFVHAFGRVGCLMAGCCYGVPYDGACAVVYHNPISDVPADTPLFPVQLLEASINILIFFVLIFACRKGVRGFRLLFTYAGLYAIVRFCLEYLRYDSIRGMFLMFSTSQWISLAMLAVSAVAFIVLKRRD